MSVTKQVSEQLHYYIVGSSEASAEPPLVLKHGDVFGVFDRFGDINIKDHHEFGVFYRGTRFLSGLRMYFAGSRPLLLSSTVRRDNVVLGIDLTNPDLYGEQGIFRPRSSLHIYRSQYLWDNTLYNQIRIRNFSQLELPVQLSIEFDADFEDIFEVRGTRRELRGQIRRPREEAEGAVLEYRGLDGVTRRTVLRVSGESTRISGGKFCFEDTLAPGAEHWMELTAAFEIDEEVVHPQRYESGLSRASAGYGLGDAECFIATSNPQFNEWLMRSRNDLRMLTTQTGYGPYPYAGVPWFATPFGRDGILTALECLWMDPEMARGVLSFLTKTQAREVSLKQDAEPGKILHEARDGEMAALGEVPFRRYYGSVDATPLYLLLAASYFRRTGDSVFLDEIWDGVERALAWIDGMGDPDGDGFVEYSAQEDRGLVQQGWKDSHDSVFHSDGSSAIGPIALCEVQAYVYAAKTGLAAVAEATGRAALSRKLVEDASSLRGRFQEAFWSARLGMYVLALDGHKRPCEVRSSNAGHALYSGIASDAQARSIAERFLSEHFYSGWGIRTIAEQEARYNPMSYHNGSIWPHDNAIISAGLSRYGFTEMSSRILNGFYQAASCLEWSRLPELFCGFRRRPGKNPTWYPTACSPQAWAAGSVFLLLKACLGLSVDARAGRVVLRYPILPDFLDRIDIRNLTVGSATMDLRLFRHDNSAAVTVERRTGELDVMVLR